jgi:hypothetical protein
VAAPAQADVAQKPADDDASILDNAKVMWSISLMAGIDNVSAGGQSLTAFDPHFHVELGGGIPTDLTRVFGFVFFDAGAPTSSGTTLGLHALGAGLGLGTKYRLSLGGGVAEANDYTSGNGSLYFGGNFTAHASVALTPHLGVHAQFSYSAINVNSVGWNFIVGGLGLGYTM